MLLENWLEYFWLIVSYLQHYWRIRNLFRKGLDCFKNDHKNVTLTQSYWTKLVVNLKILLSVGLMFLWVTDDSSWLEPLLETKSSPCSNFMTAIKCNKTKQTNKQKQKIIRKTQKLISMHLSSSNHFWNLFWYKNKTTLTKILLVNYNKMYWGELTENWTQHSKWITLHMHQTQQN